MEIKVKRKGSPVLPDMRGYFGEFGGRFVSETLMSALIELDRSFRTAWRDQSFRSEFRNTLADYSGRPTPLYFAEKLTRTVGGARIWLKREDLNHTGAHKITNAVGQALLARRMGKNGSLPKQGPASTEWPPRRSPPGWDSNARFIWDQRMSEDRP